MPALWSWPSLAAWSLHPQGRSDDFWTGESRSDFPFLLPRLWAYLFPLAFLHRSTALVRLGLAADGLAAVVDGPFSLCGLQPPDPAQYPATLSQHLPPLGAMATGSRCRLWISPAQRLSRLGPGAGLARFLGGGATATVPFRHHDLARSSRCQRPMMRMQRISAKRARSP